MNMEYLCKSCLFLRRSISVARGGHLHKINQTLVKNMPSISSSQHLLSRHYATKDRASEKKYKHGKLIVEKVEDPTLYPYFLMTFSGTDAVVLDGYLHYVKKAAKIVEVDLTKSFNMPATEQTYKAKREGKGLVTENVYNLKNYKRVVEIQNLTGEKSDIFLENIQNSMPAGVQLDIELKRWEKMVDPNHIMFRDENN